MSDFLLRLLPNLEEIEFQETGLDVNCAGFGKGLPNGQQYPSLKKLTTVIDGGTEDVDSVGEELTEICTTFPNLEEVKFDIGGPTSPGLLEGAKPFMCVKRVYVRQVVYTSNKLLQLLNIFPAAKNVTLDSYDYEEEPEALPYDIDALPEKLSFTAEELMRIANRPRQDDLKPHDSIKTMSILKSPKIPLKLLKNFFKFFPNMEKIDIDGELCLTRKE